MEDRLSDEEVIGQVASVLIDSRSGSSFNTWDTVHWSLLRRIPLLLLSLASYIS